jgi:mannose-6-phosphate isomerase-like protein (cupin superfamily)
MAETKYGKYIQTQPKPERTVAGEPEPKDTPDVMTPLVYLDGQVLEGGLYAECCWFHKPTAYSPPTHAHDFDEVLAFMGSDPENPRDLHGEVELWLGGERHILTESCMVFVPRGLEHCPMNILRAERPIFHFSTGNSTSYAR